MTIKDPNGLTRRRNKSILLKDTIIYWIAYLQKKLYQQERQILTEQKNRFDSQNAESDIKFIIRRRVNARANEIADIRRDQLMKARQLIPEKLESSIRKESREEIDAKNRQREIERSLKDLEVLKPADLYESIGGIWGGNSIFLYEKEKAVE